MILLVQQHNTNITDGETDKRKWQQMCTAAAAKTPVSFQHLVQTPAQNLTPAQVGLKADCGLIRIYLTLDLCRLASNASSSSSDTSSSASSSSSKSSSLSSKSCCSSSADMPNLLEEVPLAWAALELEGPASWSAAACTFSAGHAVRSVHAARSSNQCKSSGCLFKGSGMQSYDQAKGTRCYSRWMTPNASQTGDLASMLSTAGMEFTLLYFGEPRSVLSCIQLISSHPLSLHFSLLVKFPLVVIMGTKIIFCQESFLQYIHTG